MLVQIRPAKDKKKKYIAEIYDKDKPAVVKFGAYGYSDYTIHKDKKRRTFYIARHQKREDWSKDGIKTAGFWSRWLLWNKPTLVASAKNIEKKFNISIELLDD